MLDNSQAVFTKTENVLNADLLSLSKTDNVLSKDVPSMMMKAATNVLDLSKDQAIFAKSLSVRKSNTDSV